VVKLAKGRWGFRCSLGLEAPAEVSAVRLP
jgi:hypothetical protein